MTNGQSPSGWYQDPTAQGDARYWNGTSWTQSVNRGGVTVNVAIDPAQAQIPPTPGTQVSPPAPPTQTYDLPPEKSNNNSVLGVIFGVLAVLLVIVLIFAVVSNSDSGDDTPTPGTNAPAEEPAPAEDAPAEDG